MRFHLTENSSPFGPDRMASHRNHSRFCMSVSHLPANSFLSDVSVYPVDGSGTLQGVIGLPAENTAKLCLETGSAEVSIDSATQPQESSATLAIPVYRGGKIVSVATMTSKATSNEHDNVVGVFEVWEPTGPYNEVGLKSGFYGKMERFHNVSSFVRFECGSGLPGQVWQGLRSVIHDDLANHAGFLRAAGASADLLSTAIGIPVAGESFKSSVLLISSDVSPLVRGCEIWQTKGDELELADAAYKDLPDSVRHSTGTKIDGQTGFLKSVFNDGQCVVVDAIENEGPGLSSLAIPYFQDEALSSVTFLLF